MPWGSATASTPRHALPDRAFHFFLAFTFPRLSLGVSAEGEMPLRHLGGGVWAGEIHVGDHQRCRAAPEGRVQGERSRGLHEARGTAGNEEEPAGRRQVLADEER